MSALEKVAPMVVQTGFWMVAWMVFYRADMLEIVMAVAMVDMLADAKELLWVGEKVLIMVVLKVVYSVVM